MAYPTSAVSLDTTWANTDVTDTVHPQHHADMATEINSIETDLVAAKGTFANVATRIAARTTVRLTADTSSFTSTTLANVTGMSFSVAAGQDYYFKFVVPFTSAATTTGLGLGVTTPALTGFVAATVTIPRLVDTAGTTPASSPAFVGQITSSGDAVVADASPAVTVVNVAIIEGILSNPSSAGTLQLQARTEVSSSAIVIKKGAYGELYLN